MLGELIVDGGDDSSNLVHFAAGHSTWRIKIVHLPHNIYIPVPEDLIVELSVPTLSDDWTMSCRNFGKHSYCYLDHDNL
jgi:hypothetical protein